MTRIQFVLICRVLTRFQTKVQLYQSRLQIFTINFHDTLFNLFVFYFVKSLLSPHFTCGYNKLRQILVFRICRTRARAGKTLKRLKANMKPDIKFKGFNCKPPFEDSLSVVITSYHLSSCSTTFLCYTQTIFARKAVLHFLFNLHKFFK